MCLDVVLLDHNVVQNRSFMGEFFPIIPNGSRIFFTGSQMGVNPHETILVYADNQICRHAFCRNLVMEFEGIGTTINTIVPDFMETTLQKDKFEEIKRNIYRKTASAIFPQSMRV